MRTWWKEAVVYQIYPKSFAKGINGIISKLDYIKSLGANVIWLCPIYDSPRVDDGYDIRDYKKIDRQFGTIKDFDDLVAQAHKRKMKIIMDAVFNHTSDEHKWFAESRKSRDNKYRNYYFWRKKPNNWESRFGGSAWEYDKKTGEYYLHIWHRKQADLNWENREVRKEIYKIMKWWLGRGVDGFRFDVINFISKTRGLPDVKPMGGLRDGGRYYINGPKVDKYLKEMNREVLSKYDTMTVGETAARPQDLKIIERYVDSKNHELDMVFHENNEIRSGKRSSAKTALEKRFESLEWNLGDLKRDFTLWQENLDWDSAYLGNHDYARIVSRFGDDKTYIVKSAQMLATLILTLRATPYIYQGDETGTPNAKFRSINDFNDIYSKNLYKEYVEGGGRPAYAVSLLSKISRDNARRPINWGMNAQKRSILNYYKRLIAIRKADLVFVYGKYSLILPGHKQIYSYLRILGGKRLLVILNFSAKGATFILPKGISYSKSMLLISNYSSSGQRIGKMPLRPYEARIYMLY